MSNNNKETLKSLIEKQFNSNVIVLLQNNDIYVKSKNREDTKKEVEKLLTKSKVNFKSMFKKSKSGSIDVLNVPDFKLIYIDPASLLSNKSELLSHHFYKEKRKQHDYLKNGILII